MYHSSTDRQNELQALLQAALEAHENGDIQAAEHHYRHLLVELPEFPELYYNLGLLLFQANRYEEALETYRKGVCLPGADTDLLFNLAICQKELGFHQDALTSYEQALNIDPDDVDSHYNRGGCLMALERYEEAISAYQQVLSRDPYHLSALVNQTYILHRIGKTSLAIEGYRKILEHDPGHQSAEHMLAALNGNLRESAPQSYIRDVFDQFSDHYEKRLVANLEYRLPEKLLAVVMQENNGAPFISMLDLGCGTGLLGEHFRNITATMHGVDLSGKMIEKARQKDLYDHFYNEEINLFLTSTQPGIYDLLVAADVFNYIGSLEAIFAAAHRASTADALFSFSVEHLSDGSDLFRLQRSGRFAHSRCYIEQSARVCGWKIGYSELFDLRQEGDERLEGCIYKMTKTVSRSVSQK